MKKLDKQKIKGILIDSGYVLIYPTRGEQLVYISKIF